MGKKAEIEEAEFEQAEESPQEERQEQQEASKPEVTEKEEDLDHEDILTAVCVEAVKNPKEFTADILQTVVVSLGAGDAWSAAVMIAAEEGEEDADDLPDELGVDDLDAILEEV